MCVYICSPICNYKWQCSMMVSDVRCQYLSQSYSLILTEAAGNMLETCQEADLGARKILTYQFSTIRTHITSQWLKLFWVYELFKLLISTSAYIGQAFTPFTLTNRTLTQEYMLFFIVFLWISWVFTGFPVGYAAISWFSCGLSIYLPVYLYGCHFQGSGGAGASTLSRASQVLCSPSLA